MKVWQKDFSIWARRSGDDARRPTTDNSVVPDSGTAELEGLSGKMTINIADGKHSYEFEYTLTKTP
jgi:hypothetical protein